MGMGIPHSARAGAVEYESVAEVLPIRADLRKFYGAATWGLVRARILKRAHDKCELCKAPNHEPVERGPLGVWRWLHAGVGAPWRNSRGNITTFEPRQDLRRVVVIVLTVAHLNHVSGDDRDENLLALCQWCHLNYDKLHHKETRAVRKDAARPLLSRDV